ncbi:MAG: threonine/serine ThrE exporter family protein [Campylobacter sp.]
MSRPNIQEATYFLIDFAVKMLSIGTYTARVEKCVTRIAQSYEYYVSLMIFVKYFTISVMDLLDNSIRRTYVKKIRALPINFNLISELSALSWQIYDDKMDLCKARAEFKEASAFKPVNFVKTLLFISFANATFCKLFGGDFGLIGCVFVATAIGFCLKFILTKLHINIKIQYVFISFIVSLIVYFSAYYDYTTTRDVVIRSSILFLMPGVHLINNDNTLVGISRAFGTGIFISCIAVGVYLVLSICDVGFLNA